MYGMPLLARVAVFFLSLFAPVALLLLQIEKTARSGKVGVLRLVHNQENAGSSFCLRNDNFRTFPEGKGIVTG